MAKKGATQLDFAEVAGVDRGWLNKVLKGKEKFGARAVARLMSSMDSTDAAVLLKAHLLDEISLIEDSLKKPRKLRKGPHFPAKDLDEDSRNHAIFEEIRAKLDPFKLKAR